MSEKITINPMSEEKSAVGNSPVESVTARRRHDLDNLSEAHRSGEPEAAAEAGIAPNESVDKPSAINEPDTPLREGMDDPHDSHDGNAWESFIAQKEVPGATKADDPKTPLKSENKETTPAVVSTEDASDGETKAKLTERTQRQAAFFRRALNADLEKAGETATEARNNEDTKLPGYKGAADAIGSMRKEMTKQANTAEGESQKNALSEKRNELAQAMRTHRNEARDLANKKTEAEAAKLTQAVVSAAALRDEAQKRFDAVRDSKQVTKEERLTAERELDLASLAHARSVRRANAQGIETATSVANNEARLAAHTEAGRVRISPEAIIAHAKRRRVEALSAPLSERATKLMARFPAQKWGNRLGYAALLSMLAIGTTGNGERQGLIELNNVDGKELFEAKWNAASMAERLAAQAAIRDLQSVADTSPQNGATVETAPERTEHSLLEVPSRDGRPAIPASPEIVAGKTAGASYAIDRLTSPLEDISNPNSTEEVKESYTITKNCTLWDVLEGDTRIPQTPTFKKVGAVSKDELQALIDLVRDELTADKSLANEAGLSIKDNPKLWLYTGDVLTKANLDVIEKLAARLAADQGLGENGSLEAALKNVLPRDQSGKNVDFGPSTPKVSELGYGSADTTPAITAAEILQEKARELPDELRIFVMPETQPDQSQNEEANFGNDFGKAMLSAYNAKSFPGVSKDDMSRVGFHERQNLFLQFANQNPEIWQAMNVSVDGVSKIKPGTEIDIKLWHMFMTNPAMRLKTLKAEAEKMVNSKKT